MLYATLRFLPRISFLFARVSSAQTYGEIFTVNQANELFGPVISSVEVNCDELKNMMSLTKDVLLFLIKENKVEFANKERASLSDSSYIYDSKIVLKIVSLNVLRDLLVKGGCGTCFFEIRNNVVSITNGVYTLEKTGDCPPFCLK